MKDPESLGLKNFMKEPTETTIDGINIKVGENGRYFTAKKEIKCGNKVLELNDPLLLTLNQDVMAKICSNCL